MAKSRVGADPAGEARRDGITPGGQTAQAVSLFYDLVPETEKAACVAQLVKAVHRAQDHIDCGILGAKALIRANISLNVEGTTYTEGSKWQEGIDNTLFILLSAAF